MSSKYWLILHIAIAVGVLVASVVPGAGVPVETAEVFAESPTVEEYVSEYFTDTPILADIAWCESRNRQFGKHGDIFRGEINPKDVGVMQINEYYHLETAKKLNLNLYTLEGNLEYAQYLYDKEGTRPWNSSKPCWGNPHIVKK